MKKFSIIVAVYYDKEGIGKDGKMPWHIKEDLKYFKNMTTNGTIIMGVQTWKSLNCQPLDNRTSIIITHTPDEYKHQYTRQYFVNSLNAALCLNTPSPIFVIGGESVYREAINHRMCERLFLTRVRANHDSFLSFDRFFPSDYIEYFYKVSNTSETLSADSNWWYQFEQWKPFLSQNPEEDEYLDSIAQILGNPLVSNRTGVKTWSKFGVGLKYDLRDGRIPLQTTRKMWLRGIFEEFKWIISGSTDARQLASKGVKIWLPNSTRTFLDQRGLKHFQEGDIGATYGFSMRHFGAKYEGFNHDYTGKGYDQLVEVIRLLKEDKNSRRIVINLWDPESLNNTALPPCMFCYTFYYDEHNNELSLTLSQRSNDFITARSWNDTFGALMLITLANIADMKPGYLWSTITNAHIYENHYAAAITQISRLPRKYPKLVLKKKLNNLDDLLALEFKDLELVGYDPHPAIAVDMVV